MEENFEWQQKQNDPHSALIIPSSAGQASQLVSACFSTSMIGPEVLVQVHIRLTRGESRVAGRRVSWRGRDGKSQGRFVLVP